MKRKKPRLPEGVTLKDVIPMFERTLVAVCRECGMHRRFTPIDIDQIICSITTDDFAGTLEELGVYIEDEDWDTIVALAKQEQTMRMLRGLR